MFLTVFLLVAVILSAVDAVLVSVAAAGRVLLPGTEGQGESNNCTDELCRTSEAGQLVTLILNK